MATKKVTVEVSRPRRNLPRTQAGWRTLLMRMARNSFGVALASLVIVQPDFSQPGTAIKLLTVAFATGFIGAFFLELRTRFSTLDKLPL